MTVRSAPKVSPGVGSESAPIGTEAWAQNVRLKMQTLVNHFDFEPKSFFRYLEVAKQHRAWTLMNKPDGSFFKKWREFCAFRQPYGLGKPWEELEPMIAPFIGKNAMHLLTVDEADEQHRLTEAGPGRGHKKQSHHGDGTVLEPKTTPEELKAQRLRAITRAPEVIQDAYREGLIGQLDAAKLGPRDPEPEQAARIVEVARAIAPKVEAAKALPPKDKRKAQREVNATVREMLERPKAVPSPPAAKAPASESAYDAATKAIHKLSDEELQLVMRAVQTLLMSRNYMVRLEMWRSDD